MGAPGIAAIEKYPSRGQHAWPDPVPGQDDNLDIGTVLFNVTHLYAQTVALFPVDFTVEFHG